MGRFLERYQQGEHEQVWAELLALGELVQRNDPFLGESFFYADALAVARETMRRARYNIELLVSRLPASGYQFGYSWLELHAQEAERRAREDIDIPIDDDLLTPEILEDMRQHPENYDPLREAEEFRRWAKQPPRPFVPPSPEVERELEELEQVVGFIPLSVRAWYEIVEKVDFVGTHPPNWSSISNGQTQGESINQSEQGDGSRRPPFPGWEETLPIFDPLYVYPCDGMADHMRRSLKLHQSRPYFLPISPDA